jgi:hypothetical protein
MLSVFAISLVSTNAKDLSKGARLGRRRVHASIFPPLLINWGSISDIIQSPINVDLGQDQEAAASDLDFSAAYSSQMSNSDLEGAYNDPALDYLPPPEESFEAALGCSIVEEVIFEDVTEEQCKTESITSCQKPSKECGAELRNECNEVTETEYQQTCDDKIVNICEDIIQNFTQNDCKTVITEMCESDYQTELKDECNYETVIEKVCSTGYSVSYGDKCRVIQESQTQRGAGCRRVPRKLCIKVPKFPTKQCRNVPRIEGKCKKVPVKRPISKCSPVERAVCEEVPFQQKIKKCVYTNRPECKQTPVEVVKNICKIVETQVCPEPAEVCETVPITTCENVSVEKPQTVQREICDDGAFSSSNDDFNTSFQP